MIRVAVVDDHPHVAIALRTLLDESPDIQLVAESRRGGDVAALVRRTRPHVLLLDLFIEPEFDALAAVRRLRADFPDLKICLLSAYLEPALVRDLLQAGVYGYILKDDDYVSRIDTIIRNLADGKICLSPQAYAALAQATRGNDRGQVRRANGRRLWHSGDSRTAALSEYSRDTLKRSHLPPTRKRSFARPPTVPRHHLFQTLRLYRPRNCNQSVT